MGGAQWTWPFNIRCHSCWAQSWCLISLLHLLGAPLRGQGWHTLCRPLVCGIWILGCSLPQSPCLGLPPAVCMQGRLAPGGLTALRGKGSFVLPGFDELSSGHFSR